MRHSLFTNTPPFLNYIPTITGKKVFPPAILREQLWRIPQGLGNVFNIKEEAVEDDVFAVLFPDNVMTISNFKQNHFGSPLTQAIQPFPF